MTVPLRKQVKRSVRSVARALEDPAGAREQLDPSKANAGNR
jgi:hypothetical protein